MENYLPLTFNKDFPPEHIPIIARIESAVMNSGVVIDEMERGVGKTSIIKAAAIWSILYGYSQFVLIVGRNAQFAASLLASIKCELERNDLLMEDFPEACLPIRDLGGNPRQCLMQTYQGKQTGMRWSSDAIVMPTITGSTSSNATIRAVSSTTTMKGHRFTRHDGTIVRPTLVLVDDPIFDKQIFARLNSIRNDADIADKWAAIMLHTPVTSETITNEHEADEPTIITNGELPRLEINKSNQPTTTSAMVDAGDGGVIEDGGICVHMDLDPRNLTQIAAIQLANREKEIARLVSKDMKSESQIRADHDELWEKYQIFSLSIPHGNVITIPPGLTFTTLRQDRFQIVNIPRRDLLAIIVGKTRITNIPDGATIDAINYDFIRDAICLRVSHLSFQEVYPGDECKRFTAEVEAVR